MSKWWECTVEVPDGTAGNSIVGYIVAAGDKRDAREKTVGELSRKYPRVRVAEVRLLADDTEDETVGGWDEKGDIPRQTTPVPRLTT